MSELTEFLFSELGIKWDETSLAWVDRREGEWSSRLVITELAALIKKSRAENTRLKTLAGATEVLETLEKLEKHVCSLCPSNVIKNCECQNIIEARAAIKLAKGGG